MSAFKYQWNQTIDVGTAGLLSKQWTSIRHILSLLVTANACVHVTAYVAVRRSLSTTYTAVVLGLLLRQYVSYQFGVWAGYLYTRGLRERMKAKQRWFKVTRELCHEWFHHFRHHIHDGHWNGEFATVICRLHCFTVSFRSNVRGESDPR